MSLKPIGICAELEIEALKKMSYNQINTTLNKLTEDKISLIKLCEALQEENSNLKKCVEEKIYKLISKCFTFGMGGWDCADDKTEYVKMAKNYAKEIELL